jgi:hypothetical protein
MSKIEKSLELLTNKYLNQENTDEYVIGRKKLSHQIEDD